jgi:hypothetical protein
MRETDEPTTTVTLHALEGEPLAADDLRSMVIASALAIAERQGVTVTEMEATGSSITTTLIGERIVGIGFAAELRRVTERWYARKHGGASLWGEVRHDDAAAPDADFDSGWDPDEIDDADWWKQA